MCLNTLKFKILNIEYGWIFAVIETETEQIALYNSYLADCRCPKYFLKQ